MTWILLFLRLYHLPLSSPLFWSHTFPVEHALFISASEPLHRLCSSPTEPHGSVSLLGLYSHALSSERPSLATASATIYQQALSIDLSLFYRPDYYLNLYLFHFHFLSPVSKMEVPSGKTAVSLGFHCIPEGKRKYST